MSLEENSLAQVMGGIVITRLLHIRYTGFNNEDVVSKEKQFSNSQS